jgi:iron complex outermembrane receptor protein
VLAGVTPSPTNKYYNSPVTDSGATVKDDNVSADIEYHLGDLTLGSTTAFQHETEFNVQDLFVNSSYYSNNFRNAFASTIGAFPGSPGTWADFSNVQTQNIDVKQTSEELKLTSPSTDAFNYVAGVFFSDQKVSLQALRTFTPAATLYNVSTDTKTYDIYGRTAWKFLPTTSLVTGLRYNFDALGYDYAQIEDPVASSNSDHSGALVGDISLQQQLAEHSMVYATYAHGYAPKVFNTGIYSGGDATAPRTPLDATGQEHVEHFEIGSKGTYWDQRVAINLSAFYTVYENYQVQVSAAVPGIAAPIEELNSAGKARTEGVELDTTLAATDTLRINLTTAYVDAVFVKYTDAPCWGDGVIQTAALGCHPDAAAPGSFVQDVSGKTMPDSPKFKATLSAEQRFPLGASAYEAVLGGRYAYRSSDQFQPDQNPQTIQGSFGLLNLSLAMRERSGKFGVTLFCNNVTNHYYAFDIEDFWSPPYGANAVVQGPARDAVRYFGVRLDARL